MIFFPVFYHVNFKSTNVLLDDELAVHMSDCGLAPLMSFDSIRQVKWCHIKWDRKSISGSISRPNMPARM